MLNQLWSRECDKQENLNRTSAIKTNIEPKRCKYANENKHYTITKETYVMNHF